MSLLKKTTIYIDVETNIGLKSINAGSKAEIVSIGIAKVPPNERPKVCFYKEFKPIRPVDEEAFGIHGLSNEYLNNKPVFSK